MLNTGNGVFKESTVFEVRYTGIHIKWRKKPTPALAEHYNSLHYFVATAKCFWYMSKTNFQNSKLILFTTQVYKQSVNKIQSFEDSSWSWVYFGWSFKVKYCLDTFTLNMCIWWYVYGDGGTSFYAPDWYFLVSEEWQKNFFLFAMFIEMLRLNHFLCSKNPGLLDWAGRGNKVGRRISHILLLAS